MPNIVFRLLIAIFLLGIGFVFHLCGQTSSTEFHEGTTGYSVDFGGPPEYREYISFVSGAYKFSGNVLDWEDTVGRMRIASLFVERDRLLPPPAQRRQSYTAFLTYARKEMSKDGLTISERPFNFAGFAGVEMRSSGKVELIERSFFFNGQLVIVSAFSEKSGTLDELTARVDSFRELTENERIIALIDAYSPLPLPRTAPASFASTDVFEHRLKGPVAVVREFKRKDPSDEPEFSIEYRYDRSGFLSIEVAFSGGLPEVITSWGWVNGNSANRQASVPVHLDGYRVPSGRMIVSGAYGPGDGDYVDVRFGVMVETEFDDLARPIKRKNISNTGDLVSIINYKYLGNTIERHETDASGGFISSLRQVFDTDGILIQELSLSERGDPSLPRFFEYKNDERGNWIERTVYVETGRGRTRKRRVVEINTREIQCHVEQNRSVARQASHDLRESCCPEFL